MTQKRKSDIEMGMSPLADLLSPTLKRMGIHGAIRDLQVADVFAEVVGPALAPHCRALRISRGVLVVDCANPALAQQLHLESERIVPALNERLGGELIKRMRFSNS